MRCRVSHAHIERGVEILSELGAHEHHSTPCHDGLAQVVVELLFRVGIPRVELADTGMHVAHVTVPVFMTRSERSAALRTNSSGTSQSKFRYTAARCANGGDCANS